MKVRTFYVYLAKFFFIFCAVALTSIAWNLDDAEGKTIIRLAHHHPIKAYPHKWALNFKDFVEKESKGEIEVQIFPAGQLGEERENIHAVNMHTVDMTFAGPGFLDQYYPGAGILILPFVYDDYAHLARAFGRNGKAGKLIIEEALKRSNVRILGYCFAGFRCMYFREKAVTKLEDFEGLKMRSPENDIWLNMFRLLGSKPTPITWGEVYTSMQTGVVDGMDASLLGFYQNRMYEVAKHGALTYHMMTFMGPMINKKLYADLSPKFQEIVSEAAWKATEKFNKGAEEQNEWALGQMKKEGMQIHKIDREPLIKAVSPMIDAFAKKTDSQKLYDFIIAER